MFLISLAGAYVARKISAALSRSGARPVTFENTCGLNSSRKCTSQPLEEKKDQFFEEEDVKQPLHSKTSEVSYQDNGKT